MTDTAAGAGGGGTGPDGPDGAAPTAGSGGVAASRVGTGGYGPRVVAFGGGHGLAASLAALRLVTHALTAVVTVADDGGSSGRLRREFHVLAPGDLRMALAALAAPDPPHEDWAALLQHRFAGDGPLAGHAVGNLLLVGLLQQSGDPVRALDALAQLVGAAGRVLPMASEPVDIAARVTGLEPGDPTAVREVRGQVEVATTRGRVVEVRLVPRSPAVPAQTLAAVSAADWLVFGPGSLFTSVLPHLLVPALRAAVDVAPARRLFVLNLAPQPGETEGFAPEMHLEVLAATAGGFRLDVVLADRDSVPEPARLERAAARLGAEVVLADVGDAAGLPRHDAGRLAAAYASVFTGSSRSSRSSQAPGSPRPPGPAGPAGALGSRADTYASVPEDRWQR